LTKLYAIHGGNSLDYDGWVVLTRGIGRDPNDQGGENFKRFRQVPIVRLNHGYAPWGTIPRPEHYADFAQRCANFVRASAGCSRWIIGNEMNHEQERPDGQPITPGMYAECFTQCRDAIRGVRFHNGDQVLVGAVAPWNAQTRYAGNPSGDWIRYFEDVQHELGVNGCDGFALHTYARAQTPAAVVSPARMGPPFEMYHNGFRTYWDWMNAILPRLQGLPCYITETNAIEAWLDANTGFVTAAYDEIDGWNSLFPDRPILCLALYRWEFDRWAFRDKYHVHADFYNAVERGYAWPQKTDPPMEDDMLKNPSFEEDWHEQGAGELVLPDEWTLEYVDGDHPWCGPQGKRPEVKPNQEHVTDGQLSIRAFPPAHSRGMFGIWQEVEVEAGQWYTFAAQVRIESKPPGEMAAFVGIQPWGTGLFERQMIWGKETQVIGEWQTVAVTAQAFGNRIRVAMGANNKWPTQNNTVWWDNCIMERWECNGGIEPPNPPQNGECNFSEEGVRKVVREELDRTVWASGAG
jgi:hypothetical protein